MAAHETAVIEDEESLRIKFVNAITSGSVSNALDGNNGVRFIKRAQTIQALMDQGILDSEVALSALGHLVIDEE